MESNRRKDGQLVACLTRCLLLAILFLASFGVGSSPRQCSLFDYVESYGPCGVSNMRERNFVLRENADCVPSMYNLSPMKTSVPCTCVPSDMSMKLGECSAETNQKPVLAVFTPSQPCTLNGQLSHLPKGSILCNCTNEDFGGAFTECDEDDTRLMVHFQRRPCQENPTAPVPSPVQAPCDLECQPGEYIAPPSVFCSNCSAGTWSSPSTEWSPPYTEINDDFYDYCELYQDNNKPCNSWKPCPDGSCLQTGNVTGLNSLWTDLTLVVDIVNVPARIRFEYQVSSEKDADFFAFYIGGELKMVDSGMEEGWKALAYEVNEKTLKFTCTWSVNGHCLKRNQLFPFRSETFFSRKNFQHTKGNSASEAWDYFPYHLFSQHSSPLCEVLGNSSSQKAMKGKFVIATDLRREKCGIEQLIHLAQAEGVKGIIIVTDQHIVGPSAGINIIVAQLPVIQGYYFLRELLEKHALKGEASSVHSHSLEVRYKRNSRHKVEFSWIYAKDYSISRGSDWVRLKNIEVTGTKRHAPSCTPCPSGMGSRSGSSRCEKCPLNHFSSQVGTPYPCIQCPTNALAPVGASKCVVKKPCVLTDYILRRGPCTQRTEGGRFKQDIWYELSQPAICSVTAQFSPPTLTAGSCIACPVGTFRNAAGFCTPCRDGTYPLPESCGSCFPGKYSLHTLHYSPSFDKTNGSFPSGWERSCTDCVGIGWHFGSFHRGSDHVQNRLVLAVGDGLLEDGEATLIIEAESKEQSWMKFLYTAIYEGGDHDDADVKFEIRHHPEGKSATEKLLYSENLLLPSKSRDPNLYQSLAIPPGGKQRFLWKYKRNRALISSKNATSSSSLRAMIFVLEDLTVSVSKNESECVSCPAGYECPGSPSEPKICPPGFFSSSGYPSCLSCNNVVSSIAGRPGQANCDKCPRGFTPNRPVSNACILPNCQFDTSVAKGNPLTEIDIAYPRPAGTPANSKIPVAYSLRPFQFPQKTRIGSNQFPLTQLAFEFNFCAAWSISHCQGREFGNETQVTFGCVKDSKGNTFSMGSKMSIQEWANENNRNVSDGLIINIVGEEPCPFVDAENSVLKTDFYLECDPEILFHQYLSSHALSSCHYSIQLKSRFACPICKNNSFVYVDAPCIEKGNKRRTFYYASDQGEPMSKPTCSGGEVLPTPRDISCPYLVLELGRGFGVGYLIVFTVALLLIVLAVLTVYACISRRNLRKEYNSLRNQMDQDRVEMHPDAITTGATMHTSGTAEVGNAQTTEEERKRGEVIVHEASQGPPPASSFPSSTAKEEEIKTTDQ